MCASRKRRRSLLYREGDLEWDLDGVLVMGIDPGECCSTFEAGWRRREGGGVLEGVQGDSHTSWEEGKVEWQQPQA